jgi:cell division protein FtsL
MKPVSAIGLMVLYLTVIGLALLVVVNRHHSRMLFTDVRKMSQDRDEGSAEWARLRLEQSTRLNQVRVDARAKQELGMRKPSANEIRVIRE